MSLNVLIVDDSSTVRAVIKKTLTRAGVDVAERHEAAHGKEALEILEDKSVDLIITDINMPVMGGMEFIKNLAESETLKNIPVIVISTEGSNERIEELRMKGISAYIRKPFTPEMLREVMDNIVEADHDE